MEIQKTSSSRPRWVRAAALCITALPLASLLLAGELILHPNGFGEHSYAAWKAQEGLSDSSGNKNQALYLQKMTATTTFAAGVAVIQGIEGTPTSAVSSLEFYVRQDSHCGAGAPRWNVRIRPAMGPSTTFFVGCAGMAISGSATAPNGKLYIKRTFPGALLPTGTITSLSIVFDEGDDIGAGFAYLDNISVLPLKTWTSASDNGNN
jgi:hypothetical protein